MMVRFDEIITRPVEVRLENLATTKTHERSRISAPGPRDDLINTKSFISVIKT